MIIGRNFLIKLNVNIGNSPAVTKPSIEAKKWKAGMVHARWGAARTASTDLPCAPLSQRHIHETRGICVSRQRLVPISAMASIH